MKEAARGGSSTARIPKIPWLSFEQSKDTFVVYQLTLSWWGIFGFLTIEKSLCFTGVVLSAFNLSLGTHWFRVERKATKDGRLASWLHLTLVVEIPMKRKPVMTTQFLKKCTITVIVNIIKMPLLGKIFPGTISRIAILEDEVTCNNRTQSCAGRLHLQGNLSQRRSNAVRKTLNSTTRAEVTLKRKWHSQQQQQQPFSGDVPSSSKELVRNSVSLVDKRPQFEIGLRVEGVSQDAILYDEEQVKRDQQKVGKVENWIMHKVPS